MKYIMVLSINKLILHFNKKQQIQILKKDNYED
jgi:hypothetical protein